MYKYNPNDFPNDIAENMRTVYKLYEKNKKEPKYVELSTAIDNLYYDLKDLRTFKLKPADEVVAMQNYFRRFLYD